MDFELSDEQVLLRDSTRRLLETLTPPSEVRRLADTDTRYDAAAWARGVELGVGVGEASYLARRGQGLEDRKSVV